MTAGAANKATPASRAQFQAEFGAAVRAIRRMEELQGQGRLGPARRPQQPAIATGSLPTNDTTPYALDWFLPHGVEKGRRALPPSTSRLIAPCEPRATAVMPRADTTTQFAYRSYQPSDVESTLFEVTAKWRK